MVCDNESVEGGEVTHIREPVSIPETGSATWTCTSTTLIQTSRNGKVLREPEIHGRGYGTGEGRAAGILFSALEPSMPGSTEGDYRVSRAKST